MFSNSPVVQLFMIVVSVGIVVLFVMPTIDSFRAQQDRIAQYNAERLRVEEVTSLLNQHINTINNLPMSGRQSLERYMPNSIDEIAVMRDIESIVRAAGLSVTRLDYSPSDSGDGSVTADGEEVAVDPVLSNLQSAVFTLAVNTDYEGVKRLLRIIESNNYQFLIREASIVPSGEGATLSATLRLEVYTLTSDNGVVSTVVN